MKTKIERITLAHLSDVHLPPIAGFWPHHWNLKRMSGFANWRLGRARVHRREVVDQLTRDMMEQAPDHVVVTGDLVNLGLPKEFVGAHAWLRSLGEPDLVTAIPGNHDRYVKLRRDPGVARWVDYMSPNEEGDELMTNSRASDAMGSGGIGGGGSIVGAADDRSGASSSCSPGIVFPFCRVVGPIAVIALNSAEPTPPFNATGVIGERQRLALAGLLDEARRRDLVRVVILHHPPLPGQASRRRALRDASEVEQVLSAHGAEIVLHGHNHRESAISLKGPVDVAPVIGVASGSAGRARGDELLARYNIIRVIRWNKNVRFDITGRGFLKPGGKICDISLRSFQVRMT